MFTKIRRLKLPDDTTLRIYSTKQAAKGSVKYTNTINLPKTNFPQRLNREKRLDIERSLVKGCFANLYEYQKNNNSLPEFILHDGPPYANGELHMGHAVNKILKDITLKKHVINRKKVHYVPGWDCHGLPIELKAMAGEAKKDAMKIREKSLRFALNTLENQKLEFESWGVMANWTDNTCIYKTVDVQYIQRQLRMFLDLYKEGLVFRELKPVFWSPSSRTALAEAELEYDPNFVSPSVIFRFKLNRIPKGVVPNNVDKNVYALIWTTTPWTLPSNQAVCYHPKLEYNVVELNGNSENLYIIASALVTDFETTTNSKCKIVAKFAGELLNGATYFHPIDSNKELPFLIGSHVQETKGTGLVHTAPAHGPDDFLISLEHKIPVKCIVNEAGKYNDDAPQFLKGKNVITEGNNLVVDYLNKDIIHSGKITHSYPIDWRTKKPVIIRASEQWFINTEKLKDKAVEEVKNIKMYPSSSSEANRKLLIDQLQKRPYWCISRQRSWGVPIPVFYSKSNKSIIINEKIIDHLCARLSKEGNMDFWWSSNIKELLPDNVVNNSEDDLEKGHDIFDIWFDSGTSWNSVLGQDKVADLYLEGLDQFTGWFQSSLLTSVASRNIAPYKSIFVHGFTVDENGKKMSKSLGNVISPSDIVKKYGVDTLRWWVASHGTQHTSITISNNLIQASSESLNKIRAILRYLNGVIGERTEKECNILYNELKYLDKYTLHELYNFAEEAQRLYNSYEYNRVTALIQNFTSNQMSSIYMHLIKDRLYCGSSEEFESVKYVMSQCYYILCQALWPITTFLIEESWRYHDSKPFYQHFIQYREEWKNQDVDNAFKIIFDIRQILHQKAKDVNSWTLNCVIKCNEETLNVLKKLHPEVGQYVNSSELCEILQVSSIQLCSFPNDEQLSLEVNSIHGELCPRCRRYSIEVNETVCNRCDLILASKL